MYKELVSIIIPAYNHEKYISQTLESIVNQTYNNIELIILNDGSTDSTHHKIMVMDKELRRRFGRYIYINKKNEGVCRTLNRGLELSQGQYIVPFASDDLMLPNRIEKQVEFFRANVDYGLIYTDGYYVRAEGYIDISGRYPDSQKFSGNMPWIEGYLLDWMLTNVFLMPTNSICIRKKCYDVVGNYDESLNSEDADMFIRISKSFKIGYIKDITTIKRLHSTNAGANANVIHSLALQMIRKYEKIPMLTTEQRQRLLGRLYSIVGR